VQNTYDRLRGMEREPDFPVHVTAVSKQARAAADALRSRVIGRVEWLGADDLGDLVQELGALYGDTEQLTTMLSRLANSYPRQ
jgi:hypothetical protein